MLCSEWPLHTAHHSAASRDKPEETQGRLPALPLVLEGSAVDLDSVGSHSLGVFVC